jgi:hypothetical protein
MYAEDEIHLCPSMSREGRYLQYCCAGKRNARWRLILPTESTGEDEESVILQNVLFCPSCGKDLQVED